MERGGMDPGVACGAVGPNVKPPVFFFGRQIVPVPIRVPWNEDEWIVNDSHRQRLYVDIHGYLYIDGYIDG